jgi:CMP-2-keto-3-deoxyoctulosonic acid synthetase
VILDTIESLVYSRIKNKLPSDLKTKYANLNITTNSANLVDAKFPCIYIHMIESPESGEDMESDDVNALFVTFVIEIIDNKSASNTNELSKAVHKIMKSMYFRTIGFPYNDNTDTVYRKVCRYRRTLGKNDTL